RLERAAHVHACRVLEIPVERGSDGDSTGAAQYHLPVATLHLEVVATIDWWDLLEPEVVSRSRYDSLHESPGRLQLHRHGSGEPDGAKLRPAHCPVSKRSRCARGRERRCRSGAFTLAPLTCRARRDP